MIYIPGTGSTIYGFPLFGSFSPTLSITRKDQSKTTIPVKVEIWVFFPSATLGIIFLSPPWLSHNHIEVM